jgi:hypothetical protein
VDGGQDLQEVEVVEGSEGPVLLEAGVPSEDTDANQDMMVNSEDPELQEEEATPEDAPEPQEEEATSEDAAPAPQEEEATPSEDDPSDYVKRTDSPGDLPEPTNIQTTAGPTVARTASIPLPEPLHLLGGLLDDATLLAAAARDTAAAVAAAVAHPESETYGTNSVSGLLEKLPVVWTVNPPADGGCPSDYYLDGPVCRRCAQGHVRKEGVDEAWWVSACLAHSGAGG